MDYKLIDRTMAMGTLVGHAELAYIEADTKLRVVSWNQGATKLFGRLEDEAMGCQLSNLVPVDRQELLECKEPRHVTGSYTNPAGQLLQCEIFFTPIMNFKGEILGKALLARDISDIVRNKENLKKQQKYLADLTDFAPIGFYHVNMEGKVIGANPEFAWIMGYESAETVCLQITDFASQVFYDEGKADEFLFAVNEAEEVVRFRCRLKRQDNSFIWALCYAKATKDEAGRIKGFNGFSIDISETVRAEQELKRINERLKKLSVIDGLTKIPNRRRFNEYLESEWKRHYRTREPISVIMCDIDFFKNYNDHYGHQAGDDCLEKVAAAIAGCASRSSDLAARYGGEEFALILPGTDDKGAMIVSEKVRDRILNLKLIHEKSNVSKYVTLSLGGGTMVPNNNNSEQTLVALADENLYRAKGKGRNQSVCKKGD